MAVRDGVSASFNSATAVHDARALILEQDRFSRAPEVDWARYAPEQVPHHGKQVQQPPLLPCNNGDVSHEKQAALLDAGPRLSPKARHCGLSWRPWAVVLVSLLVLVLGLGIGLGVGLGKNHVASSTSPPTPTSLLTHGVCNDSSFAAVTTTDGTRHVFFQDVNGTLRQAQLSSTTGTWATSLDYVIPDTMDARDHTPMAAIILEESSDVTVPILLLYISQDNHLTATMFNYQNSQSWENASTFFNVSQFATKPGSRSLAISQVPNTNSSSELSLWFENSDGVVTGLLGSHAKVLPSFTPTILESFWTWSDDTADVKAEMPMPITAVSAPFSVAPFVYYNNSNDSVLPELSRYLKLLFFVPMAAPEASVLYVNDINDTFYPRTAGFSVPGGLNMTTSTTPYAPGTPSVNDTAVQASDWVQTYIGNTADQNTMSQYNFWVNGSTLSDFGVIGQTPKYIENPPASPFPYARLAVTTTENTTAFYLYHQINESYFAEDVWDSSIDGWTSATVHIATS